MASSLSRVVDNLAEGFTKLEVNIAIVFLNMKVSNVIQENMNVYPAKKIIQTSLMKN